MKQLAFLVAGLVTVAFGSDSSIVLRKPEPPIRVGLRAVPGGPPGELRVAIEVRSDVALSDTRMVVRLEDRVLAASREETRSLTLVPGETLRQELVLRGAPASGTLFVGVEGRLDGALAHRTAALEIGPAEPGLVGTTRSDAGGQAYLEVRGAATADATGTSAALSGNAVYEDKPYTRSGFTGKRATLPIRRATVQLVADDDHSVLASSPTDANGHYTLASPSGASRRVHLAVTAAATTPYYAIQVTNTKREVYALAGPSFSSGSPPASQDFTAAKAELGGAFNILDSVLRGIDLVLVLSPRYRMFPLKIFWEKGGDEGTFFGRGGIHIQGVRNDPDEYDDDVILHEFGHYVARTYSWDTSPGGDHDPFDDVPEPKDLAWSEGFATWWSSETRRDPFYVDNDATGHFSFEIEGPTPRAARGEGNEIAVSAILWDISDPANESHDRMNSKRAKLWDVASVYFPDRQPDSTLDAFCDGWIARGLGETSALGDIFKKLGASCP